MDNSGTNDTRRQIAEVFIDLLRKRSDSDISIRELCEKSKVSRRTFYNHFSDKNALVEYIWIELYRASWLIGENVCSYADFLENIYQYSLVLGDFFPASFEYTGQNNIWDIMYDAEVDQAERLRT